MKRLVQQFISKKESFKYNFPLLIRLRDYNLKLENTGGSSGFLVDEILNILGIKTKNSNTNYYNADQSIDLVNNENEKNIEELSRFKTDVFNRINKIVEDSNPAQQEINPLKDQISIRTKYQVIDELQMLLIVEGFDELKLETKPNILNEIMELCSFCSKTKVVLTSRVGEIKNSIENSIVCQICPLTETQAKKFIDCWMQEETMALSAFHAISSSPYYDTALRPLTLAHLCALYERRKYIPSKATTLYNRILRLLLEEWDEQRNITRESKLIHFSIDEKKEFLMSLGYYLTTNVESSSFTYSELRRAYISISPRHQLDPRDQKIVMRELESHTGLFIKSGDNRYQFSHKSIQEYLTARYIILLPTMPGWKIMKELPSECALMVNISSRSTSYFAKICFDLFAEINSHDPSLAETFAISFIERILLEKTRFYMDVILATTILSFYSELINIDPENIKLPLWKDLHSIPAFIDSVKELERFYIKYDIMDLDGFDNVKKHLTNETLSTYFIDSNNQLMINGLKCLTKIPKIDHFMPDVLLYDSRLVIIKGSRGDSKLYLIPEDI